MIFTDRAPFEVLREQLYLGLVAETDSEIEKAVDRIVLLREMCTPEEIARAKVEAQRRFERGAS